MTRATRIPLPRPDPRTIKARARDALEVWQKAGKEIGGMEITADGTVRILAPGTASSLSSPPEGENTCDGLFATPSE